MTTLKKKSKNTEGGVGVPTVGGNYQAPCGRVRRSLGWGGKDFLGVRETLMRGKSSRAGRRGVACGQRAVGARGFFRGVSETVSGPPRRTSPTC